MSSRRTAVPRAPRGAAAPGPVQGDDASPDGSPTGPLNSDEGPGGPLKDGASGVPGGPRRATAALAPLRPSLRHPAALARHPLALVQRDGVSDDFYKPDWMKSAERRLSGAVSMGCLAGSTGRLSSGQMSSQRKLSSAQSSSALARANSGADVFALCSEEAPTISAADLEAEFEAVRRRVLEQTSRHVDYGAETARRRTQLERAPAPSIRGGQPSMHAWRPTVNACLEVQPPPRHRSLPMHAWRPIRRPNLQVDGLRVSAARAAVGLLPHRAD
ncbi:hypothetical protein M885DRAFT_543072 [Pelagophyceae sp. CCMP2097]|nr:hypothetical protein M885DRAFT_543072 [Pelagophyceae sp. CCMP2097]